MMSSFGRLERTASLLTLNPHLQSIADTLSSGGYKGAVMHSAATGANFDELVCGKKILMVGGSYSAEDLTLQAINISSFRSQKCRCRCRVQISMGRLSYCYLAKTNCCCGGGRGIMIENEEEVKMTLHGTVRTRLLHGF